MASKKMTPGLWKEVEHFRPDGADNWGDPYKMEASIVFGLMGFRKYVGRPVHVHCGWEARTTGGWHPTGCGTDVHVEGLHVVDMYLAAERFDEFNGIGIYPNWNNPGLHLDTRPHDKTAIDSRWACLESGVYVPLAWNFLKRL